MRFEGPGLAFTSVYSACFVLSEDAERLFLPLLRGSSSDFSSGFSVWFEDSSALVFLALFFEGPSFAFSPLLSVEFDRFLRPLLGSSTEVSFSLLSSYSDAVAVAVALALT